MSIIGLDLKSCAEQLRYSMGKAAPSYATLRRWAGQNKLNAAECERDGMGRRQLYSLKALERTVRSARVNAKAKSPDRPLTTHTSQHGGAPLAPSGEVLSRLDLINDGFAILLANQERIEKTLNECVAAVQNLDAVRKTLMNKYDAVSAQQMSTIDELKTRLKASDRGGDTPGYELSLIRSQLSRLTDKIAVFVADRS